MFGFLNHSLLHRAGLAMGLITVLALSGMTSAVYVARSTNGEASAVNQAGSLRMQSYHIAAALEAGRYGKATPFGSLKMLAVEFEQRLTSPRLTNIINDTRRNSIVENYQLVTEQWQRSVLPLIQGTMKQDTASSGGEISEQRRQAFHSLIGGFVADIDNLVRLLEEDTESRIHLLGLFQGISLFLTLAVAFVTLYLLQMDVIDPLHDLLKIAEKAGGGDFNARVGHTGPDELGRLGRAFNTMAADLSKMYGDLEERVADKTKKLRQRNQSLELLYRATQYLTEAPVSKPTYHKLLDEIAHVVEANGITLCRQDSEHDLAHRITSSGPIPPVCKKGNCGHCLGDGKTLLLKNSKNNSSSSTLSIPVGDKNNSNGVLLVETTADKPLEPWQTQLLETLGKHISISMDVTRRVAQHRRLALLEERSVMARELHDSLAQSLTYLKIQVTRLSLLLGPREKQTEVEDALTELKQGLAAAYRQLRELLTTFRLQMDEQGFGPTVSKTVKEFNEQGETLITLDNQLSASPFSVNEEIHVLQIIREALSNVIHHAKATQSQVSLGFGDNKNIRICIEDNGIGIPKKSERTHHYGLAILQERANSLEGDFNIESPHHGGTKICLTFKSKITQPTQQEEIVT